MRVTVVTTSEHVVDITGFQPLSVLVRSVRNRTGGGARARPARSG